MKDEALNQIKRYIEDLEKELNELGVKVNRDNNLISNSRYLIEINGDKARELTAQLKGFKDALRILNISY